MGKFACQLVLKDGKRSSGLLSFSGSHLEIELRDGPKFRWELSEVSGRLGGSKDHLVFLTKENDPLVASVYFEKTKQTKKVLSELPYPFAGQIVSSMERKKKMNYLFFACVLVLVIIGGKNIGAYAPAVFDRMVDSVPYDVEQTIGRQLIKAFAPEAKRMSHPELEKMKDKFKKLTQHLPEEMREIHFIFADDTVVNAFALPGGYVILNRGLLEKSDSLEEVLGVVAHELSHIQNRHSLKQLARTAGLYFLADILLGDMTGMIAVILDNGQLLLSQGYSRYHEAEADADGYLLLKAANIDPSGFVTFLEKISRMGKDAGKKQVASTGKGSEKEKDTSTDADEFSASGSSSSDPTKPGFETPNEEEEQNTADRASSEENQFEEQVEDLISEIEKKADSFDFLSTHPATSKRIEAFRKRMSEDPYDYFPLEYDYLTFKNKLALTSQEHETKKMIDERIEEIQ